MSNSLSLNSCFSVSLIKAASIAFKLKLKEVKEPVKKEVELAPVEEATEPVIEESGDVQLSGVDGTIQLNEVVIKPEEFQKIYDMPYLLMFR